ncbi:MAG: four helix bundle protein [Planctomycetes bacterium]|nr:four helix bundle protein [Planctomycetota bacterium]
MGRFENLVIWQRARELAKIVHHTTRDFRNDANLRDQMRRAAISIAANIAEGSERISRPDFRRFLSIARASCGELRSHVHLALDADHIDQPQHLELIDRCSRLGRRISAMITWTERT